MFRDVAERTLVGVPIYIYVFLLFTLPLYTVITFTFHLLLALLVIYGQWKESEASATM